MNGTSIFMLHHENPPKFIVYFIFNEQEKTQLTTVQICFYIFLETTCPQNLSSYALSEMLGIIKFKICNEAPTSAQDAITAHNQPAPKHTSLSTPLHIDIPSQPQHSRQHTPKPALKNTTV